MAKIFISYRRTEAESESGRIYDHLAKWFGKRSIFKDVDNIPRGAKFGEFIKDWLCQADVLVVVIGRGWLTERNSDGMRKFDNPEDWVRIEIETAFQFGLTVIPVLLDGAPIPSAQDLPESLRELTTLNFLILHEDPNFTHDIGRLIHACELAVASRRIARGVPLYRRLRSIVARALHLRGQLTTTQGHFVVVVITLIVILGAFALHGGGGLLPQPTPTPTQGLTFPLHVLAPGAACDHGSSGAYWSNRYGTANCLTTYTRITSQNATCSDMICTGVGSLEFALAADNLKLPAKYTISTVATLMVAGQMPVSGTKIGLILQDFLPATPYGLEYAILLSADGQYDIMTLNCPASSSPGCNILTDTGSNAMDVTKSHTFGYRYDGKTTFAELDGVEIDTKSAKPPSSFKFAQLVVIGPDSHTPVSANFSDFRIQPD